MRVFSRTLLITICLHLLGACVGSPETCPPTTCLNCSQTLDVRQNCTVKDFLVCVTKDISTVEEGMTVTLTCTHNVTGGSISWLKDNVLQQEENNETFKTIFNVPKISVINCNVSSICGNFNSTLTIDVKAANNMVILLICVGAAAALLMLFAVVMKIMLKRGQAQSQARKRQRQQNLDNIHSTVNTVTSYY